MVLCKFESKKKSSIGYGRISLSESISDESLNSSEMSLRFDDSSEGSECIGSEEWNFRVDIFSETADDNKCFGLLGIELLSK